MSFTPTGKITIKRHGESYAVQDGQGRTLAFVYFRLDEAAAHTAKVLTEPEAKQAAQMIARLMDHAAKAGGG